MNAYRDDDGVFHEVYWWQEFDKSIDIITTCNRLPKNVERTAATRDGFVTCLKCLTWPKPSPMDVVGEIKFADLRERGRKNKP